MKAKKYDKVTELPANAQLVSAYSRQQGWSHPNYVYVKYDRAQTGKGSGVEFTIVCYQGMNFVIPD